MQTGFGDSSAIHADGQDLQRSRPSQVSHQTRAVSDQQSALLYKAFERSGGVASSDDVALLLRSHCDQPVSKLARWIARGEILTFVWRSHTLIPLFQFEIGRCGPRDGIAYTILELAAAFDEVDIILWFAKPNALLAHRAPADVALSNMHDVHQAARADRFIALG